MGGGGRGRITSLPLGLSAVAFPDHPVLGDLEELVDDEDGENHDWAKS